MSKKLTLTVNVVEKRETESFVIHIDSMNVTKSDNFIM